MANSIFLVRPWAGRKYFLFHNKPPPRVTVQHVYRNREHNIVSIWVRVQFVFEIRRYFKFMIVLIRIQPYNIMNTTCDGLYNTRDHKKYNIILYIFSTHTTIRTNNFWTHFALTAILHIIFIKMCVKIILYVFGIEILHQSTILSKNVYG